MLDFIINPLAGGKHGKKIKRTLPVIEAELKARGVEYAFHFTSKPRHATEIAETLCKNGAAAIVVVGGDGTLHEVINGFCNFENTALGLIPCGTGNDFAHAVRIPEDPLKALEIVLNKKPLCTDFMQMPTVRGINIIGMGIDVQVLKLYENSTKKTKATYTSCLVKSLIRYGTTEFGVKRQDGTEEEYSSFIACVANGYRYGGGIEICPGARADDKKLEFVAVRGMNKLKLISTFLKLKKGKIFSVKEAVHYDLTKIDILPKGDYTVQVDGQLYENVPFSVEIVSDKLRMFRPDLNAL